MNIRLIDPLVRSLRTFSFRGKARLLDPICPRVGIRETDIFGYRIKLDLEDLIQRRVYLHAFELRETAMVRAHLHPGGVFVDVGANIGYYTLLGASLVKGGQGGRVISFEPSPYANARLKETLLANNLSHVDLHPVALGETSATLPLYLPSQAGNHSPTMTVNEGGEAVPVPVRRLDECLRESGVDQVDLMKIDVEGFEPNVLKGAGDYLSQGRIRAILCEFNDFWLRKNGSSPDELRKMLTDYGYRMAGNPADFGKVGDNFLFVFDR